MRETLGCPSLRTLASRPAGNFQGRGKTRFGSSTTHTTVRDRPPLADGAVHCLDLFAIREKTGASC